MKNRLSTVENNMPPTIAVRQSGVPTYPRRGEDQGKHAQDERERGHQDGSQTELCRFNRCFDDRPALLDQLLGEFHDQN